MTARLAGWVAALAVSAQAQAACQVNIATGDVDSFVRLLQERQDALAQLPQDAAGGHAGLDVLVRSGVMDQVGRLQSLKLFVQLRDTVTGAENRQKVREAETVMLRSVADNAQLLGQLAEQGQKTAQGPAVAALRATADELLRVEQIGNDCPALRRGGADLP